jgi:hypothetical protein
MGIGKDLLDIPFAELVRNLAFAIAEGQLELDRSSIATLQFLMDPQNNVKIIPEISEIIEPAVRTVPVTGSAPIAVTGVTIRSSGAQPVEMSLLQAGLLPTFYQFTEATIEVKLSITMKETETKETGGSTPIGRRTSKFGALVFGSPVDYRTANTYSYAAQGSSVLRATMRPVPPPPRLIPSTVTINSLVTPPTVTRNDS